MKVLGVAAWSGGGKTFLLKRLIPELAALGLSVSTIKRAHHEFDIDRPGKDSYEHRAAGAQEVLVSSAARWALMHELRGEPEADLDFLLSRLALVDLVLVEGFKSAPIDKLEVHRRAAGQPLLAAGDPHVIAVATDDPALQAPVPLLDIEDAGGIARFIAERLGPFG